MFPNIKSSSSFNFLIFLLVVLFSFASLTSCGGGGGGGGGGGVGTTDPDAVFPLYEPGWDVSGYQASFSGTGTITINGNTINISAEYYVQTLNEEFLGIVQSGFGNLEMNTQVLPVQRLMSITITSTNETISALITIYLDAQDKSPILSQTNEGTTRIVTESNPLPATGKVGDFGELTTWLEEDGDTETGTWILKSSSPGFILLEGNYTFRNSQDTISGIETDTYKINEEGRIIEAIVKLDDYEENVVIEFTGTRN